MEDMWWDMVDDAILGEESEARKDEYSPMGNEDFGPEDEDIVWSSEGPAWIDDSEIDFSVAPF